MDVCTHIKKKWLDFCFFETGSHYVVLSVLELRDAPASVFQVLGLKTGATMPDYKCLKKSGSFAKPEGAHISSHAASFHHMLLRSSVPCHFNSSHTQGFQFGRCEVVFSFSMESPYTLDVPLVVFRLLPRSPTKQMKNWTNHSRKALFLCLRLLATLISKSCLSCLSLAFGLPGHQLPVCVYPATSLLPSIPL